MSSRKELGLIRDASFALGKAELAPRDASTSKQDQHSPTGIKGAAAGIGAGAVMPLAAAPPPMSKEG